MQHLSRRLRQQQTDAERRLWRYLRNRRLQGHKFRRQAVIGKFIVDFVCFDRKLIVELDGGQHADRFNADGLRTVELEQRGFRVIRFWNNEVLGETPAVLDKISAELLHPLPQGEGRVRGDQFNSPHPNLLPEGEGA